MDQNQHSPAHDQGANPFGLDPIFDEVKLVNANDDNISANSPVSNNSQQQIIENVKQEHNELGVSPCDSTNEVSKNDKSLDNMAAMRNSTTLTNPPIVNETPQVDDDDADENHNNDNSVEAEVTEQGGEDDDQNAIDQQQSSTTPDHHDQVHQQINQDNNNIDDNSNNATTSTGEFVTLMNQMNAAAADQERHDNTNINVVNINDNITANLPANNNSGPQLVLNMQQFLPSLFPAALPPPAHQRYASPLLASSGFHQFIHARNASSPTTFSAAAPQPIFFVGVSTGYNVGQVQVQSLFGCQYKQPNQMAYSYQHNNSQNLPTAPIMSHQYGGGSNHRQMVQNMTGGNFPLGNTHQRPMIYPVSFPQNTQMMTSAGMAVPKQSFTQLMNRAAYWSQQQLFNNYRPQQMSNQNASMANNNVVYDLNAQYAPHHGRSVPPRTQNISAPSYQQQINYQAPAPRPDQAPFNGVPPLSSTSSMMSSRLADNNSEQLEVAPFTIGTPQRRRSVVPRPAILSRSQITGNRLRTLVTDSASSNANGTNSLGVNTFNLQAIQQRGTIIAEITGQHARAIQRQEDIGESSTSFKRSRMESEEAPNENRDDSPATDAPEIMLANLRAASRAQEINNNNQLADDHRFIASSSQPANPRTVIPIPNSLYDPEYERLGLPVDPFLRMFALSNWTKERK